MLKSIRNSFLFLTKVNKLLALLQGQRCYDSWLVKILFGICCCCFVLVKNYRSINVTPFLKQKVPSTSHVKSFQLEEISFQIYQNWKINKDLSNYYISYLCSFEMCVPHVARSIYICGFKCIIAVCITDLAQGHYTSGCTIRMFAINGLKHLSFSRYAFQSDYLTDLYTGKSKINHQKTSPVRLEPKTSRSSV